MKNSPFSRLPHILYTCLILFTLLQCAGKPRYSGTPRIPADRINQDLFTPVPSIVNIPLQIETKYLQKMVNDQLNGLLFKSDTMTVGTFKNVKVRVWKKEDIKLDLKGDELFYQIPLKITLTFSLSVGALGFSHTEYQDVEAGITLNLRSRFFLKNDWKLATMTKPQGYSWSSNPVVKVRFITIPVKPVADYLISKQFDSIGDKIDETVSGSLSIKELIAPLWKKIQDPVPIKVSQTPRPIWLKLSPTNVYMTQPEGENGIIRGSFGVRTLAETYIGEKPDSTDYTSLPDFAIPGKVDSTFIVNLYSELSFEEATLMSKEMLMGKTFSSGKEEVIVQDVEVMGIDGIVVVQLDLTGSFRGRVFVIGRMVYNEKDQTLYIEDMDFDLTTRNSFHSTADWLLHGIILSKIQPLLQFPLKETMLETQVMVQQMLSHNEIHPGVFLDGRIDSLSIGGVQLTSEAFRTVILAKGVLTMKMQE